MVKRGRPQGSKNHIKEEEEEEGIAEPKHMAAVAALGEVDEEDNIKMPIDTFRHDLNNLASYVTERLIKLEDFQKRVLHDVNHVKDMDTIVADMSLRLEEFARKVDDVSSLIRTGFQTVKTVEEPREQPIKNQDIAKLQGQYAVLAEKVEQNSSKILQVQRAQLFPHLAKSPNVSEIVTDSISSLERKLGNHEELIIRLQNFDREISHKTNTIMKLAQEGRNNNNIAPSVETHV